MKIFSLSILLIMCSLLSGCLGDVLAPREDPTKFYMLQNFPETIKSDYDGSIGINIVVSGYLTRTQITSINKNGTVSLSEFNRWIETPEN